MLFAPWQTLPAHSPVQRAPDNASSVIQTSSVRLLLLPSLGFQLHRDSVLHFILQGFYQAWASAFQIQNKLKKCTEEMKVGGGANL